MHDTIQDRMPEAMLERDVHETAWGTRECVIEDNAGHTLFFGERQ